MTRSESDLPSPFPESEYRYYVKRSCGLKLVARTSGELRAAMRQFGTTHLKFTGKGYTKHDGATWGRIHKIPGVPA